MTHNLTLLFGNKQAARDFVMKDEVTNQVIPLECRALFLKAVDEISLDPPEILPNEYDAVCHGTCKIIKVEISNYAFKKQTASRDGWFHDERKRVSLSVEVLVSSVYKDGLKERE